MIHFDKLLNETAYISSETLSLLSCARSLGIYASCAGYILIECGSSRSQNAVHSVSKLIIITAVVLLTWWGLGYVLAFGRPANGLIGYGGFWMFGQNDSKFGSSHHILLQGIICVQTVLSACCSFAERLPLLGHCLHSIFMSGLVYPTIAHWMWSDDGWLFKLGSIDISGSAVVSITSGIAGLIGTWILGPRIARFHPRQIPIFGHNLPLTSVGYTFVTLGMCSLNSYSNGQYHMYYSYIPKGISITLLSGSSSVVTFCMLAKIWDYKGRTIKRRMHLSLGNALLSGMVAVSTGAGFYQYWTSLIIGFFAALVYTCLSKTFTFAKIDDPADTCAVHIAGGLVGTILFSLFIPSQQKYCDLGNKLFLYNIKSYSKIFLSNCIAIICITIWTGLCYSLLFIALSVLKIVRFSYEDELRGVDLCKFGEPAYALRIYCASCGDQLQNQSRIESLKESDYNETADMTGKIVTETEGAIVPLDCYMDDSSIMENFSSSEPC